MHFLPILSTLRRHKLAATLIVLEIALTCAIVCNAVFLVYERVAEIGRPSGLAELEIAHVRLVGIGTRTDPDALTERDLAGLRALPGVKSVVYSNMLPFGGSSWNSGVSNIPDDPSSPVNASTYLGGPSLIQTLGLKLVAGRDFTPEEYVQLGDPKQTASSVIPTRALAERLYPGVDPIGKPLYVWGDRAQTIVGVIDELARPNGYSGPEQSHYSMLLPVKVPYIPGGHYIMRVDPSRARDVLAAADKVLDAVDPNRIITQRSTFADVRSQFFRGDRAMAYLLVGVSIALLLVTAFGVVGLASFWVQQRTRQIGVRRALGATRGDILRYFQLENFILATAGIVLGMMLAYAINLWLMGAYAVPRLPAEFLPIGAASLWLLGQVAVLGPALRASMIPPAIATRSV